jgi:CSLREA domain-containing protein
VTVSRKSLSAKLTFALAVFGSGLVMVGGPPHVAHATTLTVNTAEDIGPDALTGRFPTDGKCSLRAAIRAAESNSNAHDVDCATGVPDADDVIVLDAALAGQTFRMTYAIDGNVQPFDTIISGGPLSIVGETENAADFVISGEGVVRPFTLGWFNIAAASLTLANLTVANGDGTSNGAYVGGLDGFGGAFYLGDNGTSGSSLTLDNVVLKNNSAAFSGGAIYGTMLNVTNNGGAYVGNSSTRGWRDLGVVGAVHIERLRRGVRGQPGLGQGRRDLLEPRQRTDARPPRAQPAARQLGRVGRWCRLRRLEPAREGVRASRQHGHRELFGVLRPGQLPVV